MGNSDVATRPTFDGRDEQHFSLNLVTRSVFPGECGLVGDQRATFGAVYEQEDAVLPAFVDNVRHGPIWSKNLCDATEPSEALGIAGIDLPSSQEPGVAVCRQCQSLGCEATSLSSLKAWRFLLPFASRHR